MEHEYIKHKRSHDDAEHGSGSDEDNKNNRKKSNHVIDKCFFRLYNIKKIIKIIIKNEVVLVLRFLVARTAPPLLQGTLRAF